MRLVAFILLSSIAGALLAPALLWYPLLVIVVLLAVVQQRGFKIKKMLWVLLLAAGGFALGNLQIKQYQQQYLTTRASAEVVVQITQLRAGSENLNKMSARILQHQSGDDIGSTRHININCYLNKIPQCAEMKRGQIWQLQLNFKPAHGLYNGVGFDYEQYLFAANIHATATVKKARFLKEDAHPYSIYQLQNHIYQQLQKHHYPQAANLVAALVLGFKESISAQDMQYFRHSNTAHLFAISGLHVGMVGAIFYALAKCLLSLFLRFAYILKRPHLMDLIYQIKPQNIYILCAFLGSLIYCTLAGWSLPTLRAFVMATVFYAAIILRLKALSLNNLALALVVILALFPQAILTAGLWLSFVATFWTIVIINRIHFMPKSIQGSILALLMPVVLHPLNLFLFSQTGVLSSLANLLLIPLTGLLILPLALLALLPIASLQNMILWLLDEIYQQLILFLQWLLNLPHFDIVQQPIHLAQLVSYELGCYLILIIATAPQFAILKRQNIRNNIIGSGMIFLILGAMWLCWQMPQIEKIPKNQFALDLIDVGQGLSAVVYTQNHVLVYDTGAHYHFGNREGYVVAKSTLLPILAHNHYGHRQLQNRQLSMLIISHNDNDHSGGAPSLQAQYQIGQVYVSEPFKNLNAPQKRCQSGTKWQWDGVEFAFLAPDPTLLQTATSRNDKSCVLKISAQNRSVLLTGDITRHSEQYLLKNNATALKSDYLLLAHHGSQSSSTTAFLKAANPRATLVSAGFLHHFNHPSATVLKRLSRLQIPLYNTAHCGLIRLAPSKSLPICTRRERTARWYQALKTPM